MNYGYQVNIPHIVNVLYIKNMFTKKYMQLSL